MGLAIVAELFAGTGLELSFECYSLGPEAAGRLRDDSQVLRGSQRATGATLRYPAEYLVTVARRP